MEVQTRVPRTESVLEVGHRKLFVTEAGTGEPVVLLHGGGPGSDGGVELLPQHRCARRPVPGDRPGPAGLRTVVQGHRPHRPLRRPRLRDPGSARRARRRARPISWATPTAAQPPCGWRLDRPDKVDRLILMGPGGVGTTRALPTRGLSALFDYYGGDGPSRDKLATFVREYLVYDGAAVPDELIDLRYEASIQPEVRRQPAAAPPVPSRCCAPCCGWTSPATDGWPDSRTPTLVIWGADDKVEPPLGRPVARPHHAELRPLPRCPHRPLGPVGAPRPVQLARPGLPRRKGGVPMSTTFLRPNTDGSVFGSVHLGYVVVESQPPRRLAAVRCRRDRPARRRAHRRTCCASGSTTVSAGS